MGMNVQIYNRCIGTRYCANNCPYNVRFFNYWEPVWPEDMRNQLNPDVTVRSRGIMEKCSFCMQRIRRGMRDAKKAGHAVVDGAIQPACVQSCPTEALNFGDANVADSKINKMKGDKRAYKLFEKTGTGPNVIYLKKVDPSHVEEHA